MTRRERSLDVVDATTSADVRPTRTRAERRERNKRAHAIRRELIQADYRDARARGESVVWRDIAAAYDAMPTDTVLETFGDACPSSRPEPNVKAAPRAIESAPSKRRPPAHVARAQAIYGPVREAWELQFQAATNESYSREVVARARRSEKANGRNEVCDFLEAYPAPRFADYLREEYATMKANA